MYFKYTNKELNELRKTNHQMKLLIDHYGIIKREIYQTSFEALICIIIEQQIATKTAKNIIFNIKQKYRIDYDTFSNLSSDTIKQFGISNSKVNTIRQILDIYKVKSNLAILESQDYPRIYDLLIKVKGIGPWSIQAYNMFYLCNKDVYLENDLVLQKALQHLNFSSVTKETFKPLNTIAAFYLWAFGNSKRYGKRFNTPIGEITIIEEDNKIVLITMDNDQFYKNITSENIELAQNEILAYLNGESSIFTFDYYYEGTPFQIQVYKILEQIKYGNTLTYSEIAKLIGKPNSARAVGNALNKNPLLFVLPCHRIVSKTNIGGFAYGENIKLKLLNLENYSSGN